MGGWPGKQVLVSTGRMREQRTPSSPTPGCRAPPPHRSQPWAHLLLGTQRAQNPKLQSSAIPKALQGQKRCWSEGPSLSLSARSRGSHLSACRGQPGHPTWPELQTRRENLEICFSVWAIRCVYGGAEETHPSSNRAVKPNPTQVASGLGAQRVTFGGERGQGH